MKMNIGLAKEGVEERLKNRGITRREFLKFCGSIAVIMGLDASYAPTTAEALTAPNRSSMV